MQNGGLGVLYLLKQCFLTHVTPFGFIQHSDPGGQNLSLQNKTITNG